VALFTATLGGAQRADAALGQAAVELAGIPPEGLSGRCARYEALFLGTGRPRLWLYESLARDGQLAGPSTAAVWSVYEAAGLAVAGSELPDYASVELPSWPGRTGS
jgi:nitrate reductase assembly molybdenum cofactor insertion protein NarJ